MSTQARVGKFLALVICLAVSSAFAQEEDVTFFVIGKHANFDQQANSTLEPVDFSFFSEIFFTDDGDASDAFLGLPTSERVRFRDQRIVEGADHDNLLLIRGSKRFASYAELQSWYPDGDYVIEFDSASGNVENAVLGFPEDGLPSPPTISLMQNGQALCGVVNAAKDLKVSWTAFSEGGADENGILDDLIFAILEDEDGVRVSHSGRPFEEKPYLTYADNDHVIAASAMEPDHEYELSVEHAVLNDTGNFDGIPAMTTYAVTTRLKFRTTNGGGTDCEKMNKQELNAMIPSTDGQVIMFYYYDLADADQFYGEILGLEKTLNDDWVKFYKTSENGTVGLVAQSDGAWHDPQEKNAVMLSIVTSEVDRWYEHVKDKPGIKILKDVGDGGPIRSFLLEDPGGYTVEFFQWLEN